MSTKVDQVMGQVHSQAPWAVAIWEDREGVHRCQYTGVTPEELATMFYRMADKIVTEQLPSKVR